MEKNPTWICVAALALHDRQGRWLLYRRPPDKHHGGLWEFPGGKVEPGETPANALLREIAEELGIALDIESLMPCCFAQDAGEGARPPIVILLYTATVWHGTPEPLEGGALGWFTPAEIHALAKPPLDVALAAQLFARTAV